MSFYAVYLIEYIGAPRNHYAIFVETQQDQSGTLFHVKGDIQNGMTYETRYTSKKPDLSNTFVSKSQLGWVQPEDLSRVDAVCRANPPPAKQFNGPKRINKNQPLRRCQEWTNETIGTLRSEGILLAGGDSGAGSSSGATGFSGATGSSSTSNSTAGPSRSSEPRDRESRDGYWQWSRQYNRWYHDHSGGSREWAP